MLSDANSVRPAADSRKDFRLLWRDLPNGNVLLCLFAAWVLLFQFLGNSTLGYVNSPSLFHWWQWTMSGTHDQEHAYIMPLVVLGLLWWKREELAALPKGVWWPGVGFLLLAILLHLAGYLVQQTRVSMVAFFAGIYALTGLVWGWPWLRATMFPFSLLLFSVPLGSGVEALTVPLRLLATKITAVLCQTGMGIDVKQAGNLLFDASGKYQYEVAAACSGMKSLTTIMAFGVIFGYLNLNSFWRRCVLVALAAPLAVLANVFRLTMIVVAAETFGQGAGNFVHASEWLSLLPYVPAFAVVFLAARWLGEARKTRQVSPEAEPVLIAGAEQKS